METNHESGEMDVVLSSMWPEDINEAGDSSTLKGMEVIRTCLRRSQLRKSLI